MRFQPKADPVDARWMEDLWEGEEWGGEDQTSGQPLPFADMAEARRHWGL